MALHQYVLCCCQADSPLRLHVERAEGPDDVESEGLTNDLAEGGQTPRCGLPSCIVWFIACDKCLLQMRWIFMDLCRGHNHELRQYCPSVCTLSSRGEALEGTTMNAEEQLVAVTCGGLSGVFDLASGTVVTAFAFDGKVGPLPLHIRKSITLIMVYGSVRSQ